MEAGESGGGNAGVAEGGFDALDRCGDFISAGVLADRSPDGARGRSITGFRGNPQSVQL